MSDAIAKFWCVKCGEVEVRGVEHACAECFAQAQRELEAARSGLLSLRKQVEHVGDYRAQLQGFIDKTLRDSDAGKGYASPDEQRALAEKVRESCAKEVNKQKQWWGYEPQQALKTAEGSIRSLDLAALLGKG